MQSISFLIPKDSKITFEGLNYGFYMFDSNHQCASGLRVVYKSGEVKTVQEGNGKFTLQVRSIL